MYHFDININSLASIKERSVWVVYLGLLFFFLYGSANQFALLTSPHASIVFEWEKQIPFLDIFIIPYMSSDFMFIIALMISQTRFELKVLATRITFLILVSCLIFIFFPLSSSFSKPDNVQFQFLFDVLKADLSFNQMPSLHISLAIVLFDAFLHTIKNKMINIFLFIWIIAICFSTLLVYQHHFIDIPTGALLAIITMIVIPYSKSINITQRFTTPRGLKMGLYYIALSIILILLAFYFNSSLSYLFVYFASSTLLVSIAYAFGISEVIVEKKYFVIMLPYFIANHISWLYFKNRLPLYNQIDSNIYFGRMPTKKEYQKLQDIGIKVFINLANDLKFNIYYTSNKNTNFLDMTIQDPLLLEEIYQYIKENKNKKIFIHCKFGLSRTIIMVMYYLYKEKNLDYQDGIKTLKAINPMYHLKQYMQVNAQIFQGE